MKVVFVTSESYIDHSYTIAEELQKHIDFPVFIQARKKNPELTRWCTRFNADFIKRKRFRNPLSFINEVWLILKIKKMNAGLIWFNTLNVYQIILVKLFIKRFIVTVHDVEKHPESTQHHASLALYMTFFLLKKNICVVSNTQAEIFKKRFGFMPKIFRLPVINYFASAGTQMKNTKKTGNSAYPGIVKFFFFGSVEAYKGIEILLEAAEILLKKNMNFKLGIFGKLKYNNEKLIFRINKLTNTVLVDKFIDYKKIQGIFIENDVLILPYKQVTQCGPLLIGYNESVPSICSNQPGFLEYVDQGKSGLIFDNNAEDLALNMEKIIKNPAVIDTMKEYIQTNIKQKFSMNALAQQYINNLN